MGAGRQVPRPAERGPGALRRHGAPSTAAGSIPWAKGGAVGSGNNNHGGGAVTQLGALGPLEAWDADGRAAHLTPGQQRVLVAFLESGNEPVSSDALRDRLWPAAEPQRSAALLHTYVSTLRKLFADPGAAGTGGPVLQRLDPGYILRIERSQFDRYRFEHLRAAARRATARGLDEWAETCLVDALRLWRGEALFGVPDIDFADAFVHQLQATRLSATTQRFEVGLELGRHRDLIPAISLWTEREPLNEQLARQLMVALARSERQAEALRAYDRCRRALAEAGLLPSTTLARAETDILSRRLGPAPPAPAGPSPPGYLGLAAGQAGTGTVLVGRWRPIRPPTWALTDSEICLLVEDHGGVVVMGAEADVTAVFEHPGAAVAAAVAMQEALGRRGGPLGRFAVHDRPGGATSLTRSAAVCEQLLWQARAGQVLVSVPPDSRPAIGAFAGVELRELGDHHLPGTEGPLALLQVESPRIAPSRQPPLVVHNQPRHNLPPARGRQVGREAAVEEIARHLVRDRLVTLHGPGGCGKTHLALHVARTLVSAYRHGAWVVDLGEVGDGDLVAAVVADAVGAPAHALLSPVDALARWLADRELLLVLDSCEHLLGACRSIAERLVSSCPGVSVLATSLERLGCPHEHAVGVLPLDVPPSSSARTDAGGLRANPAVALFVDQVGPAAIDDDDLEPVARICRLVDGIPLAICLAAARYPAVGVRALADELEAAMAAGTSLDVLDAAGPEPSSSRRGRLWTTLTWCVDRLTPEERAMLGRLSAFVGRFGADDARALHQALGLSAWDVDAVLGRLVDRSAVVEEVSPPGDARFRLLEAVRQFAAGRLVGDAAERRALDAAHAQVFLGVARDADAQLGRAGEAAALARLDDCAANLRQAAAWAVAVEDGPVAIELGARLWRYWFARGRLREGMQLLLAALALDPTPDPVRSRALVGSSYLSWWLGDMEYTRKSAMETLAQAQATGDEWAAAWGVMGLAAATMFDPDGQSPSTAAGLDGAVDYLAAADLPWDTGQALQLVAGTAWHGGDYGRAEAGFARAVDVTRAAGGRAFSDSLQAHGLMLALLDRAGEGAAEVESGLELADRHGHRTGVAHALTYRAAIEEAAGDHDEAARMYLLGLQAAYEVGEAWVLQWALGGLADAARRAGRPEVAAQLVGQAESMEHLTGIRLAPGQRLARARLGADLLVALGPARYADLVARGRLASVDESVSMALDLEV
jgi:predicted ATPase/DNA-binding SARP family transcriptional activator